MPRLLIVLAVAFLCWYGWQWIKKLPPEKRKRTINALLIWGSLTIALAMVVSGRAHWIVAAVAAMVPLLKALFGLALRASPLLLSWWQSRSEKNKSQQPPSQQQMTLEEAYEILGLQPGADKEEVLKAHKQLMQKLHPDRGGNEYLAVKLNQARDIILQHLSS